MKIVPSEFLVLALLPMWAAGVLLVGGGVLLTWPMIRRWWSGRRSPAQGLRVPTLEERLKAAAAASREREALDRVVQEARETIALGCAQLDTRIQRLESLLAEADRRGISAPPRREANAAARKGDLHVRNAQPAAAPVIEATTDPIAREVYTLADAGRSPLEIASALQEQVGKVELMLALRRG